MGVIRICSHHQEYQVPLIATFAFSGSEFWCPFCGYDGGFLGAGERVTSTDELIARDLFYKKLSEEYLHAEGVQVCSSTMWNGERVTPDKLPEEEQQRLKNVIKEWKYNIKP